MTKSCLLVFLCAWAMTGATFAVATTDDAASTPYAMVSPQINAALKSQAATPQGQSIIHHADSALGKTPHPLQFHLEGTLPHQGIWDQSLIAVHDLPMMVNLGLAYRMTGDRRYLDAEQNFLSAWLDLYKVSRNPIDETNLDRMIYAYDMTGAYLPQETRDKMKTFLADLANDYLQDIDRQKAKRKVDIDNWQSHRIKLIVMAAFALGDQALIERAHQAFMEHVALNIDSSGLVHDFLKRDALHYVVYSLEPMEMAALAAKSHGQDWFHAAAPNGASVALGLDWLTPFALGQKTHDDFVHSSVGFDAARAKAGMKGYSGQWEPAGSLGLYQRAALLDPKFQAIYEKITAHPSAEQQQYLDWFTLLGAAGL